MMVARLFLRQFGFDADPFESTNAEDEPRLGEYFVPPPYFDAVLGDSSSPKSQIVLAPRGSGKTAQRRMIESRSAESQFLCITYDSFELTGRKLSQVDLEFHLTRLNHLLLIAILMELEEDPFSIDSLSKGQRELVKMMVDLHLGTLSAMEWRAGIESVKSLGDKAADKWKRYGGPVAAAIQILMNKAGLGDVNVPEELRRGAGSVLDTARYQFLKLLEIVSSLGFISTYILVDKVDETPATATNANSTFKLIAPLLTDLPTLEANGVGFKFFLWDAVAEMYRTTGGRPDRIQMHQLRWEDSDLLRLLRNRLQTFSNHRVVSLNQRRVTMLNLI